MIRTNSLAGDLRVMVLTAWAAAMATATPRAATASMQLALQVGSPRIEGVPAVIGADIGSGSFIETLEEDAAGVSVPDATAHIGSRTRISIIESTAEEVAFKLEHGLVVVYLHPSASRRVRVLTPFGELRADSRLMKGAGGVRRVSFVKPGIDEAGANGMDASVFVVRHELAVQGVTPEASTFGVIQNQAEVAGTVPVLPPQILERNQLLRLVANQPPQRSEAAELQVRAEELANRLHRGTAELIHESTPTTQRLAMIIKSRPRTVRPPDEPRYQEDQNVITNNAEAVVGEPEADRIPLAQPLIIGIRGEQVLVAGTEPFAQRADAAFIGITGTPANEDWQASGLPNVNGQPGFRPEYFTDMDNAGFSYIQFVGNDAELQTRVGGELFAVGASRSAAGWGFFTPEFAVADPAFTAESPVVQVVSAGFQAIANGEHRTGGGTIGSPAGGGFAVVSDGHVVLNPDLPVGYPLLQNSRDTAGLDVNGVVANDEVAAIGHGRDPLALGTNGPKLLFLSNGTTDGAGNSTDFDGNSIVETDLRLPRDREGEIQRDPVFGFASLGTPLANNASNTVGIQFAPRGIEFNGRTDVIAIVHHTGGGGVNAGTTQTTEHFEIVRESRHFIVRWREGADRGGLELENLNNNAAVRNELFVFLCSEINRIVVAQRSSSHTVCGPAIEPASPATTALRERFAGTSGRKAATKRSTAGEEVRGQARTGTKSQRQETTRSAASARGRVATSRNYNAKGASTRPSDGRRGH